VSIKEFARRLSTSQNKEFKEDEGVKLVDEFSGIKTQLLELKKKEDKLKGQLIEYGKQFDIDAIYGSNKIARLREFERIVLPDGEEKKKFVKMPMARRKRNSSKC